MVARMERMWVLSKVVSRVVPWEKWMVETKVVESVRRWVEMTTKVEHSASRIAMVRH
jgi:hypothetical protein